MHKSAFAQRVFLIIFILLSGCGGDGVNPPMGNSKLVFQSGYETCVGTPLDAHTDITGSDSNLEKSDWELDLEGDQNVEQFWIYYEGGTSSQRFARITEDPNDAGNKVLHYWLNEAYIPYGDNKLKGRIQATIQGNAINSVTIKTRLFLHDDFNALATAPETFSWLTIQEFWNDPVDEEFSFRISVNIVKPNASQDGLYFKVHGQTKAPNQETWEDVWSVTDDTFAIPIAEWFTIETYFKEGDINTGKFQVNITDSHGVSHKVIDVTDYTYHPGDPSPDGLNNFNPMKLYAPERLITPMNNIGKTLQLYWDDLKIGSGFE